MARFIKTTAEAVGEDADTITKTDWWLDADRPMPNCQHGYMVVQTEQGKDPNNFVRHEKLHLLFTDQAEYYAVCDNCRTAYGRMQWSGSTNSYGWRERSEKYLQKHIEKKGWCEFCDPVFGNGGWSM